MLHRIESVLPIFAALDGDALSPQTFSAVCKSFGWDEPRDDGIGLWEVQHRKEGTLLVLDTVTRPVTLLCSLDSHDDYEPAALLDGSLRKGFDENFMRSAELLNAQFPEILTSGTYAPPYNWHFAHFQGLNSLVALEQSYYDPVMGVQLLLLLQPLTPVPARTAISAAW
jgi:hypothetical protein